MQTIEVTCKTACNKLKHAKPYKYDLNIYRGCQHGCRYCYALYSHEYVEGIKKDSFFKDIIVKTNIVEQLEKQFSSSTWKGQVVNLGSVTDSYQPIEGKYKIMPEVLKVFIKYKNPCIISTKSKLILRDFDLIDQLSRVAHVNIASTITAMDESVRKNLEPGGAPSLERFQVLKEFGKTKASRGVHIMPICPYLTDKRDNLRSLYEHAKDINASYVLPSSINLKGPTRSAYFEFLYNKYPQLVEPTARLFQGAESKQARKEYKKELYNYIWFLQGKYGLYSNYMDFAGIEKKPKNPIEEQLSLF